jgi:hypothetical protein
MQKNIIQQHMFGNWEAYQWCLEHANKLLLLSRELYESFFKKLLVIFYTLFSGIFTNWCL